jgi:nitrite reductase/ring-hydroxylating ferredoxin subunit
MKKKSQREKAKRVVIASLNSLKNENNLKIKVEDSEFLLVFRDNEVKIYDGVCPHLGGPLLEGKILDRTIVCPWHQYKYDLLTGKCYTVPGRHWPQLADQKKKVFPGRLKPTAVEIDGDEISILI